MPALFLPLLFFLSFPQGICFNPAADAPGFASETEASQSPSAPDQPNPTQSNPAQPSHSKRQRRATIPAPGHRPGTRSPSTNKRAESPTHPNQIPTHSPLQNKNQPHQNTRKEDGKFYSAHNVMRSHSPQHRPKHQRSARPQLIRIQKDVDRVNDCAIAESLTDAFLRY